MKQHRYSAARCCRDKPWRHADCACFAPRMVRLRARRPGRGGLAFPGPATNLETWCVFCCSVSSVFLASKPGYCDHEQKVVKGERLTATFWLFSWALLLCTASNSLVWVVSSVACKYCVARVLFTASHWQGLLFVQLITRTICRLDTG